ncbi:MAG: sigma-54 dependent transcriptional regulator [Myxococcota bacterium]
MAEKPRILVVDDQLEMARMLADGLGDHGYDAVPVGSGRLALERLEAENFDAVITDLRMAETDGLEVLAASRRLAPERPVIVMTAYSAVDTAVESIRRGAYHYLTKPFKTDELVIFLDRALGEQAMRREARALKSALKQRFSFSSIIGRSKPILAMIDVIERVADSPLPVLITGETGTGKGLVARALHGESQRASGPFVTVNCAALPEALLESELFGHVRGAFTGATQDRAGLFVQADGGTLFLDEIGELALPLQAKILHAIESGMVRPVGAEKDRAVSVRIVAATNRDLKVATREGRFREDLRYRLDVVTIEVPPLRHRREDIVDLAAHFLEASKARHPRSKVERFSAAALERLQLHGWRGNVRELENIVERAVMLGRADEIQISDLPRALPEPIGGQGLRFEGELIPVRELQKAYARWALDRCGGQKGRCAEALGIDGKTLAKWLSMELENPTERATLVERPAENGHQHSGRV